MHNIKKRLLEIASDGNLDPGEAGMLKEIVQALDSLDDDITELRMYLRKYGGAANGTN